jgi:hypothetical protein
MQIDLGTLISCVIAGVGGFTTAILYASSSHNNSRKALELIQDLRKEIAEIRSKHDALDNRIVERLSAIEKAIARMEGALSIKINSIKS